MNENGLLPCPFCGGEAHLEISTTIFGERRFRVYCTGGICGARIGIRPSMTEAVNAWNRRVGPPGASAPTDSITQQEDEDHGA